MSVEVKQLVDLITRMQDRQEEANKTLNEHLVKLRDNIHEIKNDYHGVASLSQITHDKVKEIQEQQKEDSKLIHARIDKHDAQNSDRFDNLESRINLIEPTVASVRKVNDNISKVVTGVVVAAIIWVIVQMNSGG